MKPFMNEDFLLTNEVAIRLYHEYAADQPIFDYHCHLNPADIANDRQFENLTQIWLEGDHYKWRAMRTAGVDEAFITGNAAEWQKFHAWAETVPKCIGNPLYHWTHLELRRPLGIDGTLLNPNTAQSIWLDCNDILQTPAFSARGILRQMNVKMVGTTDDPIDSLEHHQAIAGDPSLTVDVTPTWRPDRAFKIELPEFSNYVEQLSQSADLEISSYLTFLDALGKRLQHFHDHGCRAADHGIEVVRFANILTESDLTALLCRRLKGEILTEFECAQFSTAVQVWLGKRYAELGWVMQLHIGAQRNNNSRMYRLLGADAGFDSIGDTSYAKELAQLLDAMDKTDELPKTILYCLNPKDNEMLASMVGNFQGGGIAGKIQFGSAWWFNDQKDGMERQLLQLSQLGLLSQFIGMLTDSRSFLSFTRHEYFRRILCNMIGGWVERGEAPPDIPLLGAMVSDICFHNAHQYFQKN
ncbi:glucuronate isomerase [Neiella marina]|uniref:Uronate isomerase n=1 Tax=Neiella holothuriorum TaxID=2870530 RepID=A0ABS7EEC3_9GAMM|nr:glucuronate isomerase [Neiella holothuriorum]MBW8190605.1 glucuronate isomerase [Neiella holothuriorum]